MPGKGNNIITVLTLLEQSLASLWKEVGKRLRLTTSRNDRRAMTNNW
jgi:argininosuccinate lyase